MAKAKTEPRERRREGVETFRKLNQDVIVQSRMQVDDDLLARLGQRVAAGSRSRETPEVGAPDFVFYTGCNLLKTPHIALLALDIMDALGVRYQVMGGPTHCCGIGQLRTGDTDVSANMAQTTMNKLARSAQVLTWCASCQVQFTEVMLPVYERQTGARPFEMTPFMRFLGGRWTIYARCCAGRYRCAWRCTGIPAFPAWWKQPSSCSRRFPASNWSISDSPPSA
jgi:Fe-S oxidoreductase